MTGLTGQIFGCFLDYNNWTSAGEGVGAHVHSPCVYVGCALIPAASRLRARLLRVLWGRLCSGSGVFFPPGKILIAAGPAGAGSAFPLPAPGGFALAPRSLPLKTPTGERVELN